MASASVNIASALERGAHRHPERTALVFEGARWSYAELDAQAGRAAAVLRECGVGLGDRVALHLPNVPAFLWAYAGALKLGAIVVSLNAGLTAPEVSALLADSGATVLVTTARFASGAASLARALPALRQVLTVDGAGSESGDPDTGFDVPSGTSLDARMAAMPADVCAVALPPETPAAIVYTSGTTGAPRGVTLSHGNILFVMAAKRRYLGIRGDDRLLLFLPLFHCFGQNAIMNAALEAGATLVLHRTFATGPILQSLHEDGVTMVFGVPTTFVVLGDAARPRDFDGVRYFFSAAASLPIEIERRWQERFGVRLHQGYGLSETSPFASYNHRTAHRQGSVGTAIDGVEMQVVDVQDGRPLPPGTPGEIVVRGPNVMLGYWNRPDETAAVMRDGWFRTGDIGRMDADGYFSIEDRLRDLVIVGGFNVYPAEIENVLYQHPAVREAAVHGVPDPVLGERVRAVIARQDAMATSASELAAFCRERLAPHKVPAEIAFTDALPRNRSGKVLKRVLRDEYVAPAAVPAEAGIDAVALEERIGAWLAPRLRIDRAAVGRDVPFMELGLTSVLAVELASALAAWTGRDIQPTVTWSFSTAAALAAHVAGVPAVNGIADLDAEAIAALSDDDAEALLLQELERIRQARS